MYIGHNCIFAHFTHFLKEFVNILHYRDISPECSIWTPDYFPQLFVSFLPKFEFFTILPKNGGSVEGNSSGLQLIESFLLISRSYLENAFCSQIRFQIYRLFCLSPIGDREASRLFLFSVEHSRISFQNIPDSSFSFFHCQHRDILTPPF